MVDHNRVGHLGLATLSETNENTDYSDSEVEEDVTSNGVPMDDSSVAVKRSAKIQLTDQAGAFHKRTRRE